MEKDINTFIERLSELIEDRGINRHKLTKATGCDNSTIANWFSGKFFPRYSSLVVLADYFKCSVDFLLGLTDNDNFCLSKNPSSFRERFKLCLEQNQLTEYRVAKLCGIEQATISKWLIHGRMPDTDKLIKLANIFNCSIEYLLGRSDS